MRIDDEFLADVGLGELPARQRAAFARDVIETLEERVGSRLHERLTAAQVEEFGSLADGADAVVDAWLNANLPAAQRNRALALVRSNLGHEADDAAVRRQLATSTWLDLNCPDHAAVVDVVMKDMRAEIRRHAAQILSG